VTPNTTEVILGEQRTTLLTLPLDDLTLDDELRPRDRVSEAAVMEYAEAMAAGDEFPPVRAFTDGKTYWLADGWLRVAAGRAVGSEALPAEVSRGCWRDALIWSCSANATHGHRRTNADKRRSVMKMLADEEWSRWSDRQIARWCRVSAGLVCAVRADLGICANEQMGEPGTRRVSRGGKEYDMRMPQPKDRPRHEPERWALVHLYDDVDALYEHTVGAGVTPDSLLAHLNPEPLRRPGSRSGQASRWPTAHTSGSRMTRTAPWSRIRRSAR
jgi:hypothetical protein